MRVRLAFPELYVVLLPLFGPTACCRKQCRRKFRKSFREPLVVIRSPADACGQTTDAPPSCGVTSWTNPVNFESIWPNIIHRWVESMYAEIGKYTKLGQDWPEVEIRLAR